MQSGTRAKADLCLFVVGWAEQEQQTSVFDVDKQLGFPFCLV